ncbi:MAG: transcriptional regulator [Chloroflexota bacterium]
MRLGEKLQHIRSLEGIHRGLGRAMTKAEVVRAMERELGKAISHPYLCQLEGGARVHMTAKTRELLARFFKVLPGYLVDDPEGFETSLRTEVPAHPDDLKEWFLRQAETLREEPYLAHLLFKLSRAQDPMRYVALLDRMLELPPEALDRVALAIEEEAGEERDG